MAKRKTRARRDVTPGVPPAIVRRGGGHAERRVIGGEAARAVDPLIARFLGDLNKFAGRLSASMNTASRFYWDFLQTVNNWPETKKAETRFSNRVVNVAAEVRVLAGVFSKLAEECPEDALCRSLIDTLDVGLSVLLIAIADELDRIALRARQPMTAKERCDLLDDMRSLNRTLEAALTVVAWIEEEVKAIKGRPRAGRSVREPLPAEIDELLVSVSRGARDFMTALGNYREPEPGGEESTIEFLGLLNEERRKLDQKTEHFATTLRRFTDSHREAAEKGGHEEFLRFLDEKEDVLRRLTAHRRIGVSLLSGIIAVVKRRLSYAEDSKANDAVHQILYALRQYESRLQEQPDLCELLARQAANERATATARESDLPEWGAILRAKPSDGSKLAELHMLVAAFWDTGDDGVSSLVSTTKTELKERLNDLFPAKRPFSDSWVDRHLKYAIEHGIVLLLPRPRGQSRRVPDRFQVSDAAARKYGPHLTTS